MVSSSEPACEASHQLVAVPSAYHNHPPDRCTPSLQAAKSHSRRIAAASSAIDFWPCWRSSHEELRYGGGSRLADREEPCEAVVRRGHQHHTVEAVSTTAAPAAALNLAPTLAGVVALRRVDGLLLSDEPPLPAGDWQHDGGTFTSIVRQCIWKASRGWRTPI